MKTMWNKHFGKTMGIALFLILFLMIVLLAFRFHESERSLNKSKVLIEVLGKDYHLDTSNILAGQWKASMGGSTSVRNISAKNLEWKEQGYYQRNRDLGQVFVLPEDTELKSIILRTGPSDKAVLGKTPGAKVFIQFFEVSGVPVINDNDTPAGSESKHGFSKVHRCDDFLEGLTYQPVGPVYIGEFPRIKPTFVNGSASPSDEGRMVYMRWILDTSFPVKANHRYAFMVGIVTPGEELGFTLANTNMAGLDAPTSIKDEFDAYPNGWGIRREGDGSLPPIMYPSMQQPTDDKKLAELIAQALFPLGDDRYLSKPTTDGYPDVDTYRDLVFILEKK